MGTTELVVRGVIIDEGKVLLVRRKGRRYSFLPGGHIEFNEGASSALVRELREELGVEVNVTRFLGCVEHSWEDSDGPGHEINLVFRATTELLKSENVPSSLESDLEFLWRPICDLESVDFEPSVLTKLLPGWLSGDPSTGWGSTISHPA